MGVNHRQGTDDMSRPPGARSSSDVDDDPNLHLRPVSRPWSRAVGLLLLAGMVGLTLVIVYATLPGILAPGSSEPFTSSSLIFLLMLIVAWGICWQAGWRLLLDRSGEPGALFSWLVWLAMGVVLLTLTGLAAGLWLADGPPSGRELYVLVSMGCLGGWCLWLAWQRRGR